MVKRGGAALPMVLVLGALAVGCGGGRTMRVETPVARAWAVEPGARLYRDDAAVLPDTIREVLRDPQSFAQAWSRATSALDQPPPAPDLDFTRYMAVFVGAGKSSPGDQIQVDSVGFRREADPQRPDREIDVIYFVVRTIREEEPFPGDSYPIEMIRVDRSDLPVRWEDRQSGG